MTGTSGQNGYELRELQGLCARCTAVCCAVIFLGSVFLSLQDTPLLLGLVTGGIFVNVNLVILARAVAIWAEKGILSGAPVLYVLHFLIYGLGVFLAFRIGGKALPGYGIGVLTVVPSLVICVLRAKRKKTDAPREAAE